MDALGAARAGHFDIAALHRNSGRAVGADFDAHLGEAQRMDGDGRRTNLGLHVGIAQRMPGNQSFGDLNLTAAVFQIADANLGIARDADKITIVELELGATVGADGDRVSGEQRRIDHGGYPVAGIVAAYRGVAVNDAEARDGLAGLILRVLLNLAGHVLSRIRGGSALRIGRRALLRRVWLLRRERRRSLLSEQHD